MKSYAKVKFVSKILIYFSVFAVLCSGGLYALNRSQTSADTASSDNDYSYNTASNSYVELKAPSEVNKEKTTKLSVNIVAKSTQVQKMVLYACPGATLAQMQENYERCQGESLIKQAWSIPERIPSGKNWQSIIYGTDGKFTTTYNIDISGTESPRSYPLKLRSYTYTQKDDGSYSTTEITSAIAVIDTQIIKRSSIYSDGDTYSAQNNEDLFVAVQKNVAAGNNLHVHLERINSRVKKIVLYICKGTESEVVSSGGEGCILGDSEAIKKVWTTFPTDNTMPYDWQVASTKPPGDYTVRVKAWSTTDGGDASLIDNINVGVTVGSSSTSGDPTNNGSTGNSGGGSTGGGSTGGGINLSNPFASINLDSTEGLINLVFNLLFFLVAGFSVISVIIAGIYYISSSGNPDNAVRGKKAILYSVIGITISALVWVIESAVLDIAEMVLKK